MPLFRFCIAAMTRAQHKAAVTDCSYRKCSLPPTGVSNFSTPLLRGRQVEPRIGYHDGW